MKEEPFSGYATIQYIPLFCIKASLQSEYSAEIGNSKLENNVRMVNRKIKSIVETQNGGWRLIKR